MHLTLSAFMIYAVWRWGDWRNWQKYHTSMMYFALGNLLYNYLTSAHFLWRLAPDAWTNYTITEMLYTFIVFPATSLLFLSNFPQGIMRQLKHYAVWIVLYISVESLFTVTGRIEYQYGWNLGWSALFNVLMFPMLRLYYLKPLLAYPVSAGLCDMWLWLFNIPVHIPVEQR
jgi:hypothetical protein